MSTGTSERRSLYAAVWRWHFYAGLYVAPFLIMLALSGLVMLASGPIERWQFAGLVDATPGASVSHQAQLDAARAAFPSATFVRYQPGRDGGTSRVTVTIREQPHTVFVDPSTGTVRGIAEDARRAGVLAEQVHGTLLLGPTGDRLIEIAASLGIVLLVSGVYLWLPRGVSVREAFRVVRQPRRLFWRDLHKTAGMLLVPVLAFYLLSGLLWSGVWGERLVQGWSTLGAVTAAPGASGGHGHHTLNAGSSKVVPWGLEQAPLPSSWPHAGGDRITLDAAIAAAQRVGIGDRFWVGVPRGVGGIWTVAQTGLNGDVADPRRELTVHVDQHMGAVIGAGGWRDYPLAARAISAGTPLHKGMLGWWNLVAAGAVCLAILLLSVSGLTAWWLRRPARGWRLAAPPRAELARVPVATWVTAAALGLLFPLAGATLLIVAAVDWVVVRRVPALRHLFG